MKDGSGKKVNRLIYALKNTCEIQSLWWCGRWFQNWILLLVRNETKSTVSSDVKPAGLFCARTQSLALGVNKDICSLCRMTGARRSG